MSYDYKAILLKPLYARVVFLIILSLAVYYAVEEYLSLQKFNSPPTVVSTTLPTPKREKQIVQIADLFGQYRVNEDAIEKSNLNLTIAGIMYSDDPKDSQVIIRLDNNEEKPYKIGDKLPGAGTIKKITPEGIIIRRNGKLESLNFEHEKLIFAEPPRLSGV